MLVENQVGSAQFDQFGDAVAGGAQVFWEADGSDFALEDGERTLYGDTTTARVPRGRVRGSFRG
jgi:hypothetical protein